MHLCDRCKTVLPGSPFVVHTRGGYAFTCSQVCRSAILAEEERVAITQRAMSFGYRAFNGA